MPEQTAIGRTPLNTAGLGRRDPHHEASKPSSVQPLRAGNVMRACNACRQMKMKCEGGENPPCTRCKKAGRECILQTPSQRNGNQSHASPASVSDLPSIYSASPVETVVVLTPRPTSSPRVSKRKREDEPVSVGSYIPRRDLKDMLSMFRERILPHITFFRPGIFQDLDNLIETDHSLVLCSCYVTARYLPNGKAVQQMLLPEILSIVRGESTTDSLYTLLSLMVLYVYSDREPATSKPFELADQGQLKYWPLKYRIELCALRLSLHNSVQGLKTEIQNWSSNMSIQNNRYQAYLLWLQLFLTSHYYSLVCATPPSIRVDSSIRAAPTLLRRLGWPQHNRILGEIELCLIWEQASLRLPQTGEWWCPPDIDDVDESFTEEVILDTEHRLDNWYKTWAEHIQSGDNHEYLLDYHCRFTRFYISSYAVRCLRKTDEELSPLQQVQIKRCVAHVVSLLGWPLRMSPIQQDRLQYIPGSATTMATFSSLFLLATCQHFTSCVPDVDESLDIVTKIAQMMVRLAVDDTHRPRINGNILLKKVESVRAMLDARQKVTLSKENDVRPPVTDEKSPGNVYADLGEEWPKDMDFGAHLSSMEPFWELSAYDENTNTFH